MPGLKRGPASRFGRSVIPERLTDKAMSTRSRVTLVGAGAIGSRHAQAMARVAGPIDFDIVDPGAEARERTASILALAGGLRDGALRMFSRIEDLNGVPDLAIVATNSRERPQAIRSLLALGVRTLILEKVLFTRLSDYDEMDDALVGGGIRAWVNCPRSAYPRARRLKQLIDSARLHYRVEGRGWGLACNLIHHLDEFVALSGDTNVRLYASALEPAVEQAKRPGYVEFFGQITGETASGDTFAAICHRGPAYPRTVIIEAGDRRITVFPEQLLGVEDREGKRAEPYPLTPQSELTAIYVDDVLAGKDPKLPSYASASRLHRIMLASFLDHLRRVRGDEAIDECPVT